MAKPSPLTAIAYRGQPTLAWAAEFKPGSGMVWGMLAAPGIDPVATGRPHTVYTSRWLAFAEPLGPQRVLNLYFLGKFKPETRIELAFDYDESAPQEVKGFAGNGSDAQLVKVQVGVRQSCTALRFRLVDFIRFAVVRSEVSVSKGAYQDSANMVTV